VLRVLLAIDEATLAPLYHVAFLAELLQSTSHLHDADLNDQTVPIR
jgi:hypothetical protein